MADDGQTPALYEGGLQVMQNVCLIWLTLKGRPAEAAQATGVRELPRCAGKISPEATADATDLQHVPSKLSPAIQ